jgi:Fe-S-cluster containining protein
MSDDRIIREIPLIEQYAAKKEDENWRFRTFVKHRLDMEDDELDALVQETTNAVWSRIDCTQCANCCRSLQVMVDGADIARLATRLKLTEQEFNRRYVEFDANGESYFASSPCPFLKDNVCSVYEDRPKACHDFPYLHEPGFRTRMIMMIENTALCPIVYNTCEQLKSKLSFRRPKHKRAMRR